jgi:hypothetical protein
LLAHPFVKVLAKGVDGGAFFLDSSTDVLALMQDEQRLYC